MADPIDPYLSADAILNGVDEVSLLHSIAKSYMLPYISGGHTLTLLHITAGPDASKYPATEYHGVPNVPGGFTTVELPDLNPEKFGALIVSGMHGDEYMGPEAVLELGKKLCDLYDNDQPYIDGGYNLPANRVQRIMKSIDLLLLVLTNAWGRDERKRNNKNDVNLNRNFPFLWDAKLKQGGGKPYYAPSYTGALGMGAATGGEGHGSKPASEPETMCVVTLVEKLPVNLFVDAHTEIEYNGSPVMFYPWGCEDNGTDPAQSVLRGIPERADGPGAAYKEFMPGPSLDAHLRIVAGVESATAKAGLAWKGVPGPSLGAYYVGTTDDYAFSRDICNMRAFTMELVPPGPFTPAMDDVFKRTWTSKITARRTSYVTALVAALDAFAEDIVNGKVTKPIARSNWDVVDQLGCLTQPPPAGTPGTGGVTPSKPSSGGGGGGGGSKPSSGGGVIKPAAPDGAVTPSNCCCGSASADPCVPAAVNASTKGQRGCFVVGLVPDSPSQLLFLASQPGLSGSPLELGLVDVRITVLNQGPGGVRLHWDGVLPSLDAPPVQTTLVRPGCSITLAPRKSLKAVFEDLPGGPHATQTRGQFVVSWCCPPRLRTASEKP